MQDDKALCERLEECVTLENSRASSDRVWLVETTLATEAAARLTALAVENERLREALTKTSRLVADAFAGKVAAPQALDAIDDLARAALATPNKGAP